MQLLSDPEFWVGIGTLIFLAIVVWKRVPALIASSLDARAAAIAKELEEARRLRAEAEALLAEYQAKRSEEHTSELQSPDHLVCRLLLEKKKTDSTRQSTSLATCTARSTDLTRLPCCASLSL